MVETRVKNSEIVKSNSVLVGGHPRWQKFFLKENPDVKVIHPQKIRFDTKCILHANVVYINTHHIKHSQYTNVMNIVRKNNIKIQYVR